MRCCTESYWLLSTHHPQSALTILYVEITALYCTLKLPSAISIFVRDSEPLLSKGEQWVSLAGTAVWPHFGPSTKVAIWRFLWRSEQLAGTASAGSSADRAGARHAPRTQRCQGPTPFPNKEDQSPYEFNRIDLGPYTLFSTTRNNSGTFLSVY